METETEVQGEARRAKSREYNAKLAAKAIAQRKHYCALCDEVFVAKSVLQKHNESRHPTAEQLAQRKSYYCAPCGRSFIRKDVLRVHNKKFHPTAKA